MERLGNSGSCFECRSRGRRQNARSESFPDHRPWDPLWRLWCPGQRCHWPTLAGSITRCLVTAGERSFTKTDVRLSNLIDKLRQRYGGYAWEQVKVGHSDALVFRLDASTGTDSLYAKVSMAQGLAGTELSGEAARIDWLAAQGAPVPEVVENGEEDRVAWLVTRALPGRRASTPWPPDQRAAVVDAVVGTGLALHALPAADCPFDRSLAVSVPRAKAAAVAGLVDTWPTWTRSVGAGGRHDCLPSWRRQCPTTKTSLSAMAISVSRTSWLTLRPSSPPASSTSDVQASRTATPTSRWRCAAWRARSIGSTGRMMSVASWTATCSGSPSITIGSPFIACLTSSFEPAQRQNGRPRSLGATTRTARRTALHALTYRVLTALPTYLLMPSM